ncbi:adenylyl-sulfate kinase [Bacteroidota bacterium]
MSVVIWLTGISGSGKTTIAECLSANLRKKRIKHEILDGDIYRAILSPKSGYSIDERNEFRRKVIFIAELLIRNNIICIMPLVSSTRALRDESRKKFSSFVEVYVNCPIEVCKQRDPKGFYKKAREGKISNVVGIDIPYEEPLNPEIIINTNLLSISQSISIIEDILIKKFPNIFK